MPLAWLLTSVVVGVVLVTLAIAAAGWCTPARADEVAARALFAHEYPGEPIEMMAFVGGLNSIYQFFTHTEMIHRMPWWYEAVLVSPAHHRVHHGSNPRYLDANYSPVIILWDRMFGTFIDENNEEPIRYGLVKNLDSFNPVRVAVHEW